MGAARGALNHRCLRREWAAPIRRHHVVFAGKASWAEALTDEEIDHERGDYLHNLRTIARSGLVTVKSEGIAASIVVAWQRAIGRARANTERATKAGSSTFVGTVGKRDTWKATLEFVAGYETQYGYTTVLKFRTPEGACLVWKASRTDLGRGDVGKIYEITGTVKKHEEYKGEKQTGLSRCRVEAAVDVSTSTEISS